METVSGQDTLLKDFSEPSIIPASDDYKVSNRYHEAGFLSKLFFSWARNAIRISNQTSLKIIHKASE